MFIAVPAHAQYSVIEAPRAHDQDRLDWEHKYRLDPGQARRENWRVEDQRQRLRGAAPVTAVKDVLAEVKTDVYRVSADSGVVPWARKNWKLLAAVSVLLLGCVFALRR